MYQPWYVWPPQFQLLALTWSLEWNTDLWSGIHVEIYIKSNTQFVCDEDTPRIWGWKWHVYVKEHSFVLPFNIGRFDNPQGPWSHETAYTIHLSMSPCLAPKRYWTAQCRGLVLERWMELQVILTPRPSLGLLRILFTLEIISASK